MPKRENSRFVPKSERTKNKRYSESPTKGAKSSKGAKSDKASKFAKSEKPTRYGKGERINSSKGYFIKPAKSEAIKKAPKKETKSRFEDFEENPNLLIGRNPVMEAVKSGHTIDKILMQKDGEGSIKKIAALAREEGIQIQYVDKIVLDKLCPGRPHQGIAAYVAAHDYVDLKDILQAAKDKGEDPFIVLLDGLEDPHNLGAILRSADGAGAHGVVIPSRRSVSLTETVAKASAGAIEYVPVAKVSNLASAIDKLKEEGLWIAAVDMDGDSYHEARLSGPLAIVIGGEGQGVSHLVKEKCDFIVSIPMNGKVNSLNASNAAAIVLYEAEYQRTK